MTGSAGTHTGSPDVQSGYHFYEPSVGHGLAHDPFNAIVGPRPIGWIASRDLAGTLNLAPYSFFNAFNYTPPIIGFASNGRKDTVRNLMATGEFTWNLVSRPLAAAMNETSSPVAADVDEFALAGLTPTASKLVTVPRVGESLVAFECRTTQIIQLTSLTGEAILTWLVLGQVIGVHIAKQLLKGGVYDTAAAEPILRGGGPSDYFEIKSENLFRMSRPTSRGI